MLDVAGQDRPDVLGLLRVDGRLQDVIDNFNEGPWGVAISAFADMKIRLVKAEMGQSMTVVLEGYMKMTR
jgi:hypothetical protein